MHKGLRFAGTKYPNMIKKDRHKLTFQGNSKSGTQNLAIFHNFEPFLPQKRTK